MNRENTAKKIFNYSRMRQPLNIEGEYIKPWDKQLDFWKEEWRIIADYIISEITKAEAKSAIKTAESIIENWKIPLTDVEMFCQEIIDRNRKILEG